MRSSSEGASAAGLEWLPDSVRAILLVSATSNGEWGGVAAAGMAQIVSRFRPHTLLVNTSPGPAGPDRPLDCQTVSGLAVAMLGHRSVRDVAVNPPGRSFLFIPAGRSSIPLSDLIPLAPFPHLVRAAARGGTLLVYAAESDLHRIAALPAGGEFIGWFDGIVQLGEPDRPLEAGVGPPVLARVEREPELEEPTVARRSAGFTKPTDTPAIVAGRSARKAPDTRLGKLLYAVRKRDALRGVGGVVMVWIVAVIAVWLIWQGLSGWPSFQESASPSARSDAGMESSDRAPVSAGDETAPVQPAPPPENDAQAENTGADRPDLPAGVELPYSVLVNSYVTWSDAAQRRDELTRDGIVAFVSPTVIQGRGRLYYRVFAGAFEDRRTARDFMRRLVEDELKERERDWDMRPVRLAFVLGDYGMEAEASAARDRLHELGVPAYVLPGDTTTEARYRLYSGAFESEEAAAALDSILEQAGSAAVLETRRGRTR